MSYMPGCRPSSRLANAARWWLTCWKREVRRRERELYECALAVEQDEQLRAEMADWDVTIGDGIETTTW